MKLKTRIKPKREGVCLKRKEYVSCINCPVILLQKSRHTDQRYNTVNWSKPVRTIFRIPV